MADTVKKAPTKQTTPESTKTNRYWRTGPPPHIGWWNASMGRATDCWRWWNGESWTSPVFEGENPKNLLLPGTRLAASFMEWNDYYPSNARVPRVDPRK